MPGPRRSPTPGRRAAPRRRAADLAALALLLAAGAASAFAAGGWRRPACGARLAGAGRAPAGQLTLLRAEAEEGVRMRVEDLERGQELNGLITSLASFGCFVDVGADRDGFVHISRIADSFVDDVANVVQPGQTVKVWVTGVDEEGKLGLSMVKSKADPSSGKADLSAFVDFPPDQFLDGRVAGITDFGLFVLVPPPDGGPHVQGLVHISQIRDGFVEHPAEEAEVGDAVRVRVAGVVPEQGKLKLSMKPYAGPKSYSNPDEQDISPFGDIGPLEWLKGTVHHTAPFGIFVELEPPSGGEKVQGMVHVTEIRDGFVDDPTAEVEVNQEVNVRVIKADLKSGRLSLSMKPPMEELS